MNSYDQIPASKPASQASSRPPESSPQSPPILASRGNGFVARLPKAVRDQLNQMMLDGVRYAEIIERLGEPAKHLKPDHLTEWKKRGHQASGTPLTANTAAKNSRHRDNAMSLNAPAAVSICTTLPKTAAASPNSAATAALHSRSSNLSQSKIENQSPASRIQNPASTVHAPRTTNHVATMQPWVR